jgi:hypothetical protein
MISFVHFISLIYNFLLEGIFSTAFDERRITMAREKEGYRDNLERIKEVFTDKEMLSISDVVRFTGMCYRSVMKRFTFKNKYISVADLARQMSI